MSRISSHAPVSESIQAERADDPVRPRPAFARVSFDPARPTEVTLEVGETANQTRRWTFDRDLFTDATTRPVGQGDVQLYPVSHGPSGMRAPASGVMDTSGNMPVPSMTSQGMPLNPAGMPAPGMDTTGVPLNPAGMPVPRDMPGLGGVAAVPTPGEPRGVRVELRSEEGQALFTLSRSDLQRVIDAIDGSVTPEDAERQVKQAADALTPEWFQRP